MGWRESWGRRKEGEGGEKEGRADLGVRVQLFKFGGIEVWVGSLILETLKCEGVQVLGGEGVKKECVMRGYRGRGWRVEKCACEQMCVQCFLLRINPRHGVRDSSIDVPSKSAQNDSVLSVLLQSLLGFPLILKRFGARKHRIQICDHAAEILVTHAHTPSTRAPQCLWREGWNGFMDGEVQREREAPPPP